MRAEIGGSGTRTTVSPGRSPRRPGRRRRRDLSPRLSETSSESGYGRWCSATAAPRRAAATATAIVTAASVAATLSLREETNVRGIRGTFTFLIIIMWSIRMVM